LQFDRHRYVPFANGGMEWFDGTFGGVLGRGFGGLPILGELETAAIAVSLRTKQ
jgi:hypothetical protein